MALLNSTRGRAVVMVAHVAGMIDLVALPVWVGTLVQHYRYDFEQAGLTVTLFLLGVVAASLLLAPRFMRLPRRMIAIAGYGVSAAAFLLAAASGERGVMLALHALAGLGAGCGLSITHGTIGRSPNPHRLFAMAGAALGGFAVLFYGVMPRIIATQGGSSLFVAMGSLMALAALACFAFPDAAEAEEGAAPAARMSVSTRLAIAGVVCMTLNQAIIFSFLERIGVTRGFGIANVNLVLAAIGLVNLLPAPLAALLQQRLSAVRVAITAPLVQAALALTIAASPTFWPYAAAASVYAFVLIFAHTFLFGLLARLDPGGRAVALTPAMLMAGSAFGPALAGALAQRVGFGGLGVATAVVALVATACFVKVGRAEARIKPPVRMDSEAA
ncbi:MAG: MFS transporter [Pseudomonadota bacterium]